MLIGMITFSGGWHIPEEILSGTFKGNYNFSNNVTFQNKLNYEIESLGTFKSCKDILEKSFEFSKFKLNSGIYKINPKGNDEFEVYCDMITDGGGWTKIEYSEDLEFKQQFIGGDAWRYLDEDFKLKLTKQRILDIQSISNEGKQLYVGDCNRVVSYYDLLNLNNHTFAFGFKFLNEEETNFGEEIYNIDIKVLQDDCKYNDNVNRQTIFEINDIRVPIINVKSRDNGDSNEKFGSLLTQNPAWLR